MARYIDVDIGVALIDASDLSVGTKSALKSILYSIKTADVQEVKHGKWIECKGNSGYKCSVCGMREKYSAILSGNHNYCCRCNADMKGGAKMDKEETV